MALRTVSRSGAWSRRWTAAKPTSSPNQRILTAMASAASSHGEGDVGAFIDAEPFGQRASALIIATRGPERARGEAHAPPLAHSTLMMPLRLAQVRPAALQVAALLR